MGWWDVSKETYDGTGKERARAYGVNIIGWKDICTEAGTGTERSRADEAKTIG